MVGDISDDSPWVLYEQFRTPFPDMGMNILGDLPIVSVERVFKGFFLTSCISYIALCWR